MRLIDADALPIRKAYIVDEAGFDANFYVVDVENIDCATTIDSVPVVHGRWTLNPDGSGTCNQCHRTQKNVWDYDGWQNFCGCCGAKMDGEADEN